MRATLWLVCNKCRLAGHGRDEAWVRLATYNSPEGWVGDVEDVKELDRFYAAHSHGSARGDELILVREEP